MGSSPTWGGEERGSVLDKNPNKRKMLSAGPWSFNWGTVRCAGLCSGRSWLCHSQALFPFGRGGLLSSLPLHSPDQDLPLQKAEGSNPTFSPKRGGAGAHPDIPPKETWPQAGRLHLCARPAQQGEQRYCLLPKAFLHGRGVAASSPSHRQRSLQLRAVPSPLQATWVSLLRAYF